MEEQQEQEVQATAPERLFDVTFRENRRFELLVRGELIVFVGAQRNPEFPEKYRAGVPESVVTDPDFATHAEYFNVAPQEA